MAHGNQRRILNLSTSSRLCKYRLNFGLYVRFLFIFCGLFLTLVWPKNIRKNLSFKWTCMLNNLWSLYLLGIHAWACFLPQMSVLSFLLALNTWGKHIWECSQTTEGDQSVCNMCACVCVWGWEKCAFQY